MIDEFIILTILGFGWIIMRLADEYKVRKVRKKILKEAEMHLLHAPVDNDSVKLMPRLTVLETLQNRGLHAHDVADRTASPRMELLGHLLYRRFTTSCRHCKRNQILSLQEVVLTKEINIPERLRTINLGNVCNLCGGTSPYCYARVPKTNSRMSFLYEQNFFDVIDMVVPPKDALSQKEEVEETIEELEEKLNLARLRRAKLEYETGKNRSLEPYRGKEDSNETH